MHPLTWRTYRSKPATPVPVASSAVTGYRLETKDLPGAPLEVGAYEGARAIRSGQSFVGGQSLPSDLLRDDIVLARPEEGYSLERVIARPVRLPPRLTSYQTPRMVGPSVALTAGSARPGDGQWKILQGTALEDGLFSVEPGYVGSAFARIRGEDHGVVFDYDPAEGAVYAEYQDGGPVPAEAPLELLVRAEKTLRVQLETAEETITDRRTGAVLATATRAPARLRDRRELTGYDTETKWHALDQAHFDASPIPDGHKWIIQTDASRQNVREAVRRTLPAGTVYRVEPASAEEPTAPETVESFLLSYVPDAAAAYGLRYLSAGYTGPVVRLRKGTPAGGNVQHKDFTPEELADGTLEDWKNAGEDPRVTLLFDQSGSGNAASQPALEDQPLLTSYNGRPAVYQPPGDGYLEADFGSPVDDYSMAVVGGSPAPEEQPTLYEIIAGDDNGFRRAVQADSAGAWTYYERKFMAENLTYTPPAASGTHQHIVTHEGDRLEVLYDGTRSSLQATDTDGSTRLLLLNDENRQNGGGYLQEAILWPRGLSAYEERRVELAQQPFFNIS